MSLCMQGTDQIIDEDHGSLSNIICCKPAWLQLGQHTAFRQTPRCVSIASSTFGIKVREAANVHPDLGNGWASEAVFGDLLLFRSEAR
jgi:hypothetical protein